MVSVSLRQNPSDPVRRNATSSELSIADLGLTERLDGYYDWAGRRLFLADRSPDPMTPGAYRYQAHPDLCDPTAPESDPASPRYEPPHLRHRPGDTWEIGGKPHDPDDPGPYGTAGWRPDPRTGRHRRDELPDPIPPWERQDETPASESAAPPPIAPDRPSREPRRRNRFWPKDEDAKTDRAPEDQPYRFSKLREEAWDRFVLKSADLAAAHQMTALGLGCEYGLLTAWLVRVCRWIIAIMKGPKVNESATTRPGSQLAHAIGGAQAARTQLTAHWREPARQTRPRPSPLPYMTRWEQAFDAQRGFGEAVVW